MKKNDKEKVQDDSLDISGQFLRVSIKNTWDFIFIIFFFRNFQELKDGEEIVESQEKMIY